MPSFDPQSLPIVPIAQALEDRNGDTIPDRLLQPIRVRGVVTIGTGVMTDDRVQVYIQDDTDVDYVVLEVRTCECSAPIFAVANTNTCTAVVNYALPVFTDDCDMSLAAPVCTPPSGATFPAGQTTVTCISSDAAGNRGRCSFRVIVTDPRPAPLTIQHVGTNVVIMWPVTCTPDTLEQTTVLLGNGPPTVWTPVGAPVTIVGGQYRVVVPVQTGNRFFRVRRF